MIDIILSSIHFSQPQFLWTVFIIIFTPVWWNIVARCEYNYHFLSRFFGSRKRGCYVLAVAIFCLSLYRDFVFKNTMQQQPKSDFICESIGLQTRIISIILFGVGTTLVLSSYYQLGITGTYLGDYFGIMMEKKVEGFPFNILNNPMYFGSSVLFLASSLWECSPAGIVLTMMVYTVYHIASFYYEGPFTNMIYSRHKAVKSS
eukprot:TRINITY_DN6467_c0_g1_i1.p1 TRINITY_DN6467_c0_g1~~TRINITY_DN6467_c0_g1_i1.p1  ORF type:complete len:203 (-),score=31.00 TRINITY_DN6467_c0_g1_i1:11-619(-)